MFHGIDERIGVEQFSKLALFWRRLIERTDAREVPKGRPQKRKSSRKQWKLPTVKDMFHSIVHDTTHLIEEVGHAAEQYTAAAMKNAEAVVHYIQGLRR